MIDFSLVTVTDPFTYAFTYGRVSSKNAAGTETVTNAGTTFTSASIPATTLGVNSAYSVTGTLLAPWNMAYIGIFESSFLRVATLGDCELNYKFGESPIVIEKPYQFWS